MSSSYFPFVVMFFGFTLIIFSGMISNRLRQTTIKFENIPYYNSMVLYFGIALFCLMLGILLGINSKSSDEYVFTYPTFYGTFSKFLLWIVSVAITINFGQMLGDNEIIQLKLYDPSTWGLIVAGMSFGIGAVIVTSIYMYYTINIEFEFIKKGFAESSEEKKLKEEKNKLKKLKAKKELAEAQAKKADADVREAESRMKVHLLGDVEVEEEAAETPEVKPKKAALKG